MLLHFCIQLDLKGKWLIPDSDRWGVTGMSNLPGVWMWRPSGFQAHHWLPEWRWLIPQAGGFPFLLLGPETDRALVGHWGLRSIIGLLSLAPRQVLGGTWVPVAWGYHYLWSPDLHKPSKGSDFQEEIKLWSKFVSRPSLHLVSPSPLSGSPCFLDPWCSL